MSKPSSDRETASAPSLSAPTLAAGDLGLDPAQLDELPYDATIWLTDVLVCDRCGGPRVVIATIHDQELADEMLDAMKIEQEVPEVSRARPPPELEEWDGQLQLDVDDVA